MQRGEQGLAVGVGSARIGQNPHLADDSLDQPADRGQGLRRRLKADAEDLGVRTRRFLKEVGDPATGEPIGTTAQNLASAVAGETYEFTAMYPGFARTAREEGFDEIADWMETLARAEKTHAGRFQKALDGVTGSAASV